MNNYTVFTGSPFRHHYTLDTIEEFNVDSKAECDQLNLAQVARKKNIKKKKLKQTNGSAHIVQFSTGFKIRESSPGGIRKTTCTELSQLCYSLLCMRA